MTGQRGARVIFAIGFVVLLADGAAAIWLGQVSGRGLLVAVGIGLVVAALALIAVYRRWMAALDAVREARTELKVEVGRLRAAAAAAAARGGRSSLN